MSNIFFSFAANEKIREIKSKPKNTAQMVSLMFYKTTLGLDKNITSAHHDSYTNFMHSLNEFITVT